MELQPVKRYAGASFPTRVEIDASPETLRAVPRRWQRSAAVGVLLAGLGLAAAPAIAAAAEPQLLTPVARVAPIFTSASERITMAGGPIGLRNFLPEEEARKIISEEAAKAGLTFEMDAAAIADVPLTGIVEDGRVVVHRATIVLDGVDTTRRIAYEYISKTDIDNWRQAGITPVNPMTGGDIAMLREGITQRAPEGAGAIFYDPAVMMEHGALDLREQVVKFLGWLKAEGVI